MSETVRNERRILGGAVRRIREAKKITQAKLATDAGQLLPSGKLHDAYLCNIEKGHKQPSLDVMAAIATALGVDLADISYFVNVYVVEQDAA